MSISAFFRQLGAPLRNIRWSWGAVRADGTVVLRVWDDLTKIINGEKCWLVEYQPKESPPGTHHGYWERKAHVALIRSGRRYVMVICTAADAGRHVPYSGSGVVRKIVSFNDAKLLVGGELVDQPGGWTYARIGGFKPASAFGHPG